MQTEFPAPPSSLEPDWNELAGQASDSHYSQIPRMERARGARFLVTGAGGFIGAEMVRGFAASGAEKIVLLDLCEQHSFDMYRELTAAGHGERCVPVLGSVCDRALLAEVFAEHRPEIVLHAAALKHVALMERNPLAAVATNALGTWRVAQAAEEHGARQVVLVSTDKAAAPRSIMGASKRIAELVMLAPSAMRKPAVRLVNVLGSPGSVGPLFAEQIARGGPVTVTHPEARRYFFTLGKTAHVLGSAVAEGLDGLLVPVPGEAMRIAELAQRMIGASGSSAKIVFTELRPGEKVDEALVGLGEELGEYASPLLRRVTSPPVAGLEARLEALDAAVAARDVAAVLRVVIELAPDYEPSEVVLDPAAEWACEPL
ncbi:MAG TPA: polysaccharide biosynthesis protein [Acidobacteriaceae bacterium]|nr:polysaccharide biosynthesis protein [Acidobacteriaceae bacterium]